jgi:hypothetical protein
MPTSCMLENMATKNRDHAQQAEVARLKQAGQEHGNAEAEEILRHLSGERPQVSGTDSA